MASGAPHHAHAAPRMAGGGRRSFWGLLEAGISGLAQRRAVEREPLSVVDQAIQNGGGEGGLVDHRMPGVDRGLLVITVEPDW